jgi:O-antigen ligase
MTWVHNFPRHRVLRQLALPLLVASVLASPGLLRLPLGLWALAVLGAAAIVIPSQRSFTKRPALLWFLFAATAATAFQLVPLPEPLVALLSPLAAESVADTHRVLGLEPPSFLPLSLDPDSTAVDLVRWIGLSALAIILARIAAGERGRQQLLRAIAWTGLATGVCAILHAAFGATRVFGIYEPHTEAELLFLSPLVNPNHLSALLVVTSCVAGALAARARESYPKLGWALACAGSAGLCLFLRSRAGVLLLGVALLVLGALVIHRRRSMLVSIRGRRQMFLTLFFTACVVTVLLTLAGEKLFREFTTEPLTTDITTPGGRLTLWASSAQLILESPWVGIGRGAFESTISRVYPSSHIHSYGFAENEYLQTVVDWGIPLALVLGALFVIAIGRALRRLGDDTLTIGAGISLLALLVHAFVDFGLETPALSAVAIALVCVLDRPTLLKHKVPRKLPRRVFAWSAAVLVGGLVLATATPLREDRRALRGNAPQAVEARARAAMLRHSQDPFAAAMVAAARTEAGDRQAFALGNHALRRQPNNPTVHHLVARLLYAAGRPQQACIEYRLAATHTAKFAPIMSEVVARYRDPQAIADCLPAITRVPISTIGALRGIGQDAAALLLARKHSPTFDGHRDWIHLAELEMKQQNVPEALAATDHIDPTVLIGLEAVRVAHVLFDAGSREAGFALLTAAELKSPPEGRALVLLELGRVFFEDKRHDDALAVLNRAQGISTEPKILAQIHRERARVEQALGNQHRALWEEARAKELSP